MRIDVFTIFPDLVGAFTGESLVGKAVGDGHLDLRVHDLIGATVVDQHGTEHGPVTSVEVNPASDLLVLEGGGLVPLTFVVDHVDGRITVDIPDGLL